MDTILRHLNTVITMERGTLQDTDIRISGQQIVEVGHNLVAGDSTNVLDCAGLVAMPGLVDGHSHVESGALQHGEDRQWSTELKSIRAAGQIGRLIPTGVTTLADAGCRGETSFALKNAVEMGYCRGPRLLVCGEMIRMTGGRSGSGLGEVDGPYSARRAARQMLAKGADFIKLGATGAVSNPGMKQWSPQLTLDEMTACCEEAHKAGLKVHSHA